MSGEGLALAIKQWLPTINPEFCLTSADIMFTKPCKEIFITATKYANVNPDECWYCGDGKIPDVDGAKNAGMLPVLIDEKSEIPLEFREEGGRGVHMAVNNWNVLNEYLKII